LFTLALPLVAASLTGCLSTDEVDDSVVTAEAASTSGVAITDQWLSEAPAASDLAEASTPTPNRAVTDTGQCSGIRGFAPSTFRFTVTTVDRGHVRVKLTVTQPPNLPAYSAYKTEMLQTAVSGFTRPIFRTFADPSGRPATFTVGPSRVSLAAGPNTFSFTSFTLRESCSGSVVY
jgi:hypothetical protein